MIVRPHCWKKAVSLRLPIDDPIGAETCAKELLVILKEIVRGSSVFNLSLSGGIDSTLLLSIMREVFDKNKRIRTYTISCRRNHPDVIFSRIVAQRYSSSHVEMIYKPEPLVGHDEIGDNAVRQLYDRVRHFSDECIAGDGIDELLCGYYDHVSTDSIEDTYLGHISRLVSDHLDPLNRNSGSVGVWLPYLDGRVVNHLSDVSFKDRLEGNLRKAIMVKMATIMGIPEEIMYRNKYGFCDAFLATDKVALSV